MVPDGPTCHELFFLKSIFSWKLNSEKKYNLCYCCLKVSGFSFLLCSFYSCRKTGWYYFILRLLQKLDDKVFDSNYWSYVCDLEQVLSLLSGKSRLSFLIYTIFSWIGLLKYQTLELRKEENRLINKQTNKNPRTDEVLWKQDVQ